MGAHLGCISINRWLKVTCNLYRNWKVLKIYVLGLHTFTGWPRTKFSQVQSEKFWIKNLFNPKRHKGGKNSHMKFISSPPVFQTLCGFQMTILSPETVALFTLNLQIVFPSYWMAQPVILLQIPHHFNTNNFPTNKKFLLPNKIVSLFFLKFCTTRCLKIWFLLLTKNSVKKCRSEYDIKKDAAMGKSIWERGIKSYLMVITEMLFYM